MPRGPRRRKRAGQLVTWPSGFPGRRFTTRGELIRAFEYLAFLCLGPTGHNLATIADGRRPPGAKQRQVPATPGKRTGARRGRLPSQLAALCTNRQRYAPTHGGVDEPRCPNRKIGTKRPTGSVLSDRGGCVWNPPWSRDGSGSSRPRLWPYCSLVLPLVASADAQAAPPRCGPFLEGTHGVSPHSPRHARLDPLSAFDRH